MIVDKPIEIMTCGKAIPYYKNLGYECGYRTIIVVNQKDLSPGSSLKIEVECDFCGAIYTSARCDLNRSISGKHACKKCSMKNAKEGNLKKYGVDSARKLDSVKEKAKATCLEKYGVDNPFKNKQIQEKQKATVMQRYGVDNVFRSVEIQDKIKQTWLKKYSVNHPLKSPIIKEKIYNTCVEKYGVGNPLLAPEIQNQIRETNFKKYGVSHVDLSVPAIRDKYKATMIAKYGTEFPTKIPEIKHIAITRMQETNLKRYGFRVASKNEIIKNKIRDAFVRNASCVPCSKNQLYLSELFTGRINVNVGYYFLDITFPESNIYCEYDGSGHDLCVRLGYMSKDDFQNKELIRYKYLKEQGYKLFRIQHLKKALPDDNILLFFKNFVFTLLNNTHLNWVCVDLDHYTITSKEFTIQISNNRIVTTAR